MKCPFCGGLDSTVVDSRVSDLGDKIRRRRQCASCQKRFTTFEEVDIRLPVIVKQNGQRQECQMKKIRESFMRALHKRPVSIDLIDESVDRIRQYLLSLGTKEVSSMQVGEWVMGELRRLDKVAFIRFASVYRSFQEPEDFEAVVHDLRH